MEFQNQKAKILLRKLDEHKFKIATILAMTTIIMSISTMEEILRFLANFFGMLMFIIIVSNLPFILANGLFLLVIYCLYRIATG